MFSGMTTRCLALALLIAVSFDVTDGRAEEDHWSFQPIQNPALPAVKNSDWVKSQLDRFVLARLEVARLAPADRASPTKLIRRLYLDLTGLPPTHADIDEFMADKSPDAYCRLVDRILASPRYGERWGRHWLDVARYADSNGLDENRAYVHAFNYRDYVIRSFNSGTPFDQFLKEQLAGDLLPIEATDSVERLAIKIDRMVATGFLVVGPKGLREVDGTKMEMDIIDDQIATVCKAFMALTFECARCHDHKFDPISTRDYYSLAGVFKSTRTMTQIVDGRGKGNGFWLEQAFPYSPAEQIRFEIQLAAHNKALAAARSALPPGIAKIVDLDAKNHSTDQQSRLASYKAIPDNADRLAAYLKLKDEPPPRPAGGMAMSVSEGVAQNLQVHVRGSHLDLGDEVSRGVPSFLTHGRVPLEEKSSGRLKLAEWLAAADHPLTSRVIVNRIWRWHFGSGLVRTPDNFGYNGESPSHPDLLDWLAADFMRSGWSMKRLHRMIVLSSTYQQACRGSAELDVNPLDIDPENRLMWHFPRVRMDAEQVRDSILFVGGRLDMSMGGSLLTLKPRDYVTDAQSFKHLVTYNNRRRSVYQPVIRNKVYSLFRLFDFPTPSLVNGDRASTNVPAQALLLMNGPLATRSAADLAESLLGDSRLSDEQRVIGGYLTVLARRPNPDEVRSALAFVRSYQRDAGTAHAAWKSLVHALVVSNEFLYVE